MFPIFRSTASRRAIIVRKTQDNITKTGGTTSRRDYRTSSDGFLCGTGGGACLDGTGGGAPGGAAEEAVLDERRSGTGGAEDEEEEAGEAYKPILYS